MLLLHLGHHGRFFFQSIPGTFTDITSWLLSCLVYFCASSGVMQSEQGIPLRPLPSVRILSLAFQRACWNVAPADCRYFFTARWRAALLFGGIFWIFFFFFFCAAMNISGSWLTSPFCPLVTDWHWTPEGSADKSTCQVRPQRHPCWSALRGLFCSKHIDGC